MPNFAKQVKDQTDKILRQQKLDPAQGISVSPGNQNDPTPIVIDNSQALARHKVSGDHDTRYYTKAQADAKYAPIFGIGYIVRQLFTGVSSIVFAHNLGRKPITQVIGANASGYGTGLYGAVEYGGLGATQVLAPTSIVHDSNNQVTVTLPNISVGEVVCIG